MSETRKPVFTEEDFKDMQQRFPTAGSDFAYGARFMMLHYEHLITSGKLRVVEEGDWRELDLVEEWYFQPTKCLSCGVECITAHPGGNYAPPNYCPGCGNKFKR